MKTLSLFVAGLAVGGLLTSAAPAQQGRGGGGLRRYLSAKSVQDELKLSEDDVKKVTDALAGLDPNLLPEERAEKTKQILKDNLKEDQVKRLNQIMWQREGIGRAISNPDVRAALKLDDKQKDQVKTIVDDSRKKISDLGRPSADNRDKIQELRKKANEDITAVLTDDQKKAWQDLLGPEFKGEVPRRGQ